MTVYRPPHKQAGDVADNFRHPVKITSSHHDPEKKRAMRMIDDTKLVKLEKFFFFSDGDYQQFSLAVFACNIDVRRDARDHACEER